jgi:hypothetical protein
MEKQHASSDQFPGWCFVSPAPPLTFFLTKIQYVLCSGNTAGPPWHMLLYGAKRRGIREFFNFEMEWKNGIFK